MYYAVEISSKVMLIKDSAPHHKNGIVK